MGKIITKKIFLLFLTVMWQAMPVIADSPITSAFTVDASWANGYNAHIILTNDLSTPLTAWSADFDIPAGQKLGCAWNANSQLTGQHVKLTNLTDNGSLDPQQSVVVALAISNPSQTTPAILALSSQGTPKITTPPAPTNPCSFNLGAQYVVDSSWQGGYQISVTLSNNGTQPSSSWSATLQLPTGHSLSSIWNAISSVSGSTVTIKNPAWAGGGTIAPGASITVGMVINKTGTIAPGISNLVAIATIDPSLCSIPLPIPAAPVLDPITASGANYSVNWHSVANATQYILEQSSSATFANVSIAYQGSALSKAFQNQPNGTYYYRVSASNASGKSSASTTASVTINVQAPQTLDAPVLNAIQNTNGANSYSITWNAVAGAQTYQLEESSTNSFSPSVIVFNGAATSFMVSGKSNGTYYYRVKATASGVVSQPSNIASTQVNQPATSQPKKIVGYYANWSIYRTPAFYPQNINASLITHLNYAFLKHDVAGNVALFDSWADVEYRDNWNVEKPYWGNFRQIYDLKQKYPHLKTLISVGGWTLSDNFSQMAANAQARANFVSQCIAMCDQYNFDGIDIDWEYPNFAEHNGQAQDTQNFTQLLKELYQAAKAHSPQLLVTIAAPAGPNHYQDIEVSKIHNYLDWINIMCYDFAGSWDTKTGHHAPLYQPVQGEPKFNASDAVSYYESQGVPPEKIVMGIPLYGRSYANVNSTTDGLYAPFNGAGTGTTEEAGYRFFSDIKKNLLGTYTRFKENQAQAPYLFNLNNHEFITYDDEESIALKCNYIKQHNYGGAMIWELGLDTPAWDGITTIVNNLK
ncbi:cellulose binding domain-containing protein [Candidatus Dependentiae bacterium]|nr:cellulose binding domain-containing protein [Candidatus Dependentiae bacterium]